MIAGRRRFQNWTVARVFFCSLPLADRFAVEVVAQLGADRQFLARFCRLACADRTEARWVMERVQLAQLQLLDVA